MYDYEKNCPECDGQGYLIIHSVEYPNSIVEVCCHICHGRKKLSWIDKIKGVKKCPDGDYCGFKKIDGEWYSPC